MTLHDLVRAVVHGHGVGERSGHAVLTGRPATLYDRFCAGWLLRGLYRAVAAQLVAAAPQDCALLDVGTGPGQLLLEVAGRRPDLRLLGVDLSPDMIRMAQRRARAAGMGDRIDFRVGAAETLPLPDGSVDVVVSTLSAHHWADVSGAVAQQARVLTPGGDLWVYDLRRACEDEVAAALAEQFPSGGITRSRLGRFAAGVVVCQRATKAPSPTPVQSEVS